jgi:hypothetical protein
VACSGPATGRIFDVVSMGGVRRHAQAVEDPPVAVSEHVTHRHRAEYGESRSKREAPEGPVVQLLDTTVSGAPIVLQVEARQRVGVMRSAILD